MTKQVINVGTTANDKKGDSLRLAFQKVNTNFTELYTALGLVADANLNLGNFVFTDNTLSLTNSNGEDSTATQIEIAQPVRIESDLTVGGDILPQGNLTSRLGSPTNKFHSIYVGTGSVYIGDAKLSLEGGRISSNVGFDLTASVGVVNGTVGWADVTDKPSILTNLENNDTLTFADGLNIFDSVISRRLEQLGEGTVDAIGSKLTLTDNSIAMEAYADPDGLNNIAYGRVTAGGGQVVLKGAVEDVAGETSTIATIGGGFTVVSTDGVVTSVFGVDMGGLVLLSNNHYIEPLANDLKIASNGDAIISSNSTDLETTRSWTFDKSGTVTTPLMLPATFTAVLDDAHRSIGSVISGTPWQFEVAFVVGLGGVVETQMDNPFPNLDNPGYASGDEYEFAEADHGIPGFTFVITLNDVVLPGGAGWTANVAVTPPPEYPSTVSSLGAIKLSANDSDWVFDPNGTLHYPDGSFGSTAFVGDATRLYGNVDEDVEVTVRHRPTVSADAFTGSGEGIFVADIEFNDDITVIQVGDQINLGTPSAPIWFDVTAVDASTLNRYIITVPGVNFVEGDPYEFTKLDETLKTWSFNNETGTLIAPNDGTIQTALGNLQITAENYLILNSGDYSQIEIGRYQAGGVVVLGGTTTLTEIDGDLKVNGNIRQNHSFTRTTSATAPAATSTVVWSANADWMSSIKLTIQVEGHVTGDATGWHVQTCEATIASRGYANGVSGYGDPEMSVYGIIYTSLSPLATFEVQRNVNTRLVEVLATGTDLNNNIIVSIHSVEIGTTD